MSCALRCVRLNGALNCSPPASAWAARPLAVGAPPRTQQERRQRMRGPPVLRRSANQRLSSKERSKLCVQAVSLYRRPDEIQQSKFARSCNVSSLQRPCGVPQRRAAGSAQAPASPVLVTLSRLAGKECKWSRHTRSSHQNTEAESQRLSRERALSNPRPNPSIEGTCNIWLRQLSPAPHVKR